MEILTLPTADKAFAQGGNRLCFVYPEDRKYCIKVARSDRSPEQKKAEKSFPRNLKPVRFFDENRQELRVYKNIDRWIGDSAYTLIPRHLGIIDTNYGSGFITEIITDDDGLISISLKQYVWQFGITPALEEAISVFKDHWVSLGMPSRNLLLHNIVVQQSKDQLRLVVIDGLGWSDIFPIAYIFPSLARRKAARKASRLDATIEQLLETQKNKGDWGYHGWLEDEKKSN